MQATEIPIKGFISKTLTLNLREDSILEVDFLPNQRIEAYDIDQMLRAVYKIGNGKKFKNLVAVGEGTWLDTQAMKLYCSTEGSLHKTATAFVIENAGQRIVRKFLMTLMKPKNPTKFFASKQQAENWLIDVQEN